MKRITAVILSLCLVLCSCGKSSEPLVKRELIDQNKHEEPPKDADETKERKKIIPIKLFDASDKELGDIEIAVKNEEGATMNIDSLKEAIPVDVCNMTEALFFTHSGTGLPFFKRGYALTQKPVYVQHIQAMELTCDVSAASPSPTPNPPTPSASKSPEPSKTSILKPSVKPSATATPEPSPTPEKKKINMRI